MWERILVPLDGSEVGEAVVPYVQELRRDLRSQRQRQDD